LVVKRRRAAPFPAIDSFALIPWLLSKDFSPVREGNVGSTPWKGGAILFSKGMGAME